MIKERMFEEARKKKILQKYYATVGHNSAKARDLIKSLNFDEDPYLLQCIALTYFDESLIKDDGSFRQYFDGKKLRLAERYIIKAYILNEDCIDVLYTLGKIRNGYGQKDLAIYCFKQIIKIGKRKIAAKDKCTDRSLVKIKVNDSKFQLYRLYYDKGDYITSKKYLTLYKNGLKKGIDTIFKPLEKYLMD